MPTKDRIACLDGLRAISIALVLFGHLGGTHGSPIAGYAFSPWLASFGVRVFFVISGFLITGILFDELDKTRSIHLGRFYFRRTLRIFVPYYAFLAGVFILDRAGVLAIPRADLAMAATYTTNYNLHAVWPVAHTWSLSVEEQFYLLWPAALVLLGRRRALFAAAAIIVLVPLVRIAEWQLAPAWHDMLGHRFETVCDALATGCLLAGVRGWLGTQRAYLRLASSRLAFVAAVALVFGAIAADMHPRVAFLFGWSLQSLGIAFIIDACLRHTDRLVPRLLDSRPLVQIGKMSYAIYLWQQLFLDRESSAAMCRFPLNLVLLAVAATVAYYAVDLTAMALRARLERRLFAPLLPPPASTPARDAVA